MKHWQRRSRKDEEKITVDFIAGTNIGALIGAVYDSVQPYEAIKDVYITAVISSDKTCLQLSSDMVNDAS